MPEPAFAYLIRMFPQTSETFIAGEILRIERLGLPLRIYSCRRPVEQVMHESVRSIRSPITYLPDPLWKSLGTILGAMRGLRTADGQRFGRTLRYVLRTSVRNRSLEVWKRFAQAACLAQELRSDGIEHVHAHFAHSATEITMLAGMLTGLPFSFTGHARDIYTAKQADLRAKIAAAEFAVTCTGANRAFLQEIGGRELSDKVMLGYHGVDVEKFARRSVEPASEVPTILSVGRLVDKKGFSDFVDALSILKDRGTPFGAIIVGGGPEKGNLSAQIERLGLTGQVTLLGVVSQEALVGIYKEATVFALACRILDDGDRDGIPNVLMESMATGLPVVTTPISGIPEVVRGGENGLLVPERDPAALASALDLLLHDGELRRRLGDAARATMVAEMSADAMAQKLADLFFKAIGRSQAPTEAA